MCRYPEMMSYIIKLIADARIGKMNKQVLKQLSPKEKKIAKLVASGYLNKDIADKLKIQSATVKKHLGNIFNKLHVKDRISLVIMLSD
jgi:DNA-binding NarL/FixJ family response regulator